jgi:hypothetical protein
MISLKRLLDELAGADLLLTQGMGGESVIEGTQKGLSAERVTGDSQEAKQMPLRFLRVNRN